MAFVFVQRSFDRHSPFQAAQFADSGLHRMAIRVWEITAVIMIQMDRMINRFLTVRLGKIRL